MKFILPINVKMPTVVESSCSVELSVKKVYQPLGEVMSVDQSEELKVCD